MKTGVTILTSGTSAPSAAVANQSVEVARLHCPQCRRTHLRRLRGTITVPKGKDTKVVPTDFAHCDYCGVNSVISEVPFSRELVLTEAFFPGTPYVSVQETSPVSSNS